MIRRVEVRGYKSIECSAVDVGSVGVMIGSNGVGKSNFVSVFDLAESVLLDRGAEFVNAMGGMEYLLNNSSKKIDICLHIDSDTRLDFEISSDGTKLLKNGKKPNNPADLLGKWRVFHIYDTSRTAGLRLACRKVEDQKLNGDGSNLASFLHQIKTNYQQNYQNIIEYIRFIAPFFGDFIFEENGEEVKLFWSHLDKADRMSGGQLSDGTIRFVCLATLLLAPRQMQPDCIIIDEPELGLHPFAVVVLAELIKKAAQHCQVIVSTQSADLLSEFSPQDVIVIDRVGGQTVASRLDLDALGEWLDGSYSLGELWKKNLLGGRLTPQ